MSIINQTLRELDQRKAASSPPSSFHVSLTPVASSFAKKTGFQVAGVVFLLFAGLGAWLVGWPIEEVTSPQHVAESRPVETPASPVIVAVALPEPLTEKGPMPLKPDQLTHRVVEQKSSKGQDAQILIEGSSVESSTLAAPLSLKAVDQVVPSSDIRKEINKPSAEEDAEERYRKAVILIQKGRENLARPLLEEAIRVFPDHVAARHTLATLLNEAGHSAEAEAVLRDGRVASPDNALIALNLARLQAARGDVEGAVITLQSGSTGRGVNAEYRATHAALLARLKQYAEAAHQYDLALKLQPEQGTWWMGLGLAMAAQGKSAEARAAYSRALSAGTLSEKLEEFVRAKLAE